MSDEERLAGELVEASGDFAGAAVGGALGLIGGLPGVAAGAAGGVVANRAFKRVGAVLRQRWLDPRQVVRVGGAYALAADQVRQRLEAGEALRDDGFFDASDGQRPPADELLEGVLKSAGEAYEERKVPYIANLYASLVFRTDISPPYASALIQLADRCTWRQLVILSFLDPDPPDFSAHIGRILDPRTAGYREPHSAVWVDFDGLASAGLVGVNQDDNSVARPSNVWGGGSFEEIGWSKAAFTPTGRDLFDLMRLRDVPAEDLAELSAALGAGARRH